MENNALFDQLLNKYLLATITEEETRQFFEILKDPACQAVLRDGREKCSRRPYFTKCSNYDI
jgi:hypothetical protein